MATKGISYQLGRFAALKVEDDDDEIEQESKAKQTSKNQQQNASAKKRNKKKKKAEAASEDAQVWNWPKLRSQKFPGFVSVSGALSTCMGLLPDT